MEFSKKRDEVFIENKLVILKDSWNRVLLNHDYPPVINKLLGELLVCSTLLANALKFDGSFTIQIQGSGPIQMLIAECNSKLQVRATATLDQNYDFYQEYTSLLLLVDKGTLSIGLNPKKGGQSYHSVIPIIDNDVCKVFEHYLMQSEQVGSKLKLYSDNQMVGGLLLQKMPTKKDAEFSLKLWNHLDLALDSCSLEDLYDSEAILSSLSQDEELRIFDEKAISFSCNCTREKVSEILLTLGEKEANEIVANEGSIKVTCEFCKNSQEFDAIDVTTLFSNRKGPSSIH